MQEYVLKIYKSATFADISNTCFQMVYPAWSNWWLLVDQFDSLRSEYRPDDIRAAATWLHTLIDLAKPDIVILIDKEILVWFSCHIFFLIIKKSGKDKKLIMKDVTSATLSFLFCFFYFMPIKFYFSSNKVLIKSSAIISL